ncbi:MAG: SLC13 family permease [Clostridia bacterium]
MKSVVSFIKNNLMPIIAWALAIVSMAIIPIDKKYADYFNIKTLACLFLIMLCIGAFKNLDIFTRMAKTMIKSLKNTKSLFAALIFITYISSIFIANDIALLTFLPLTLAVFQNCKKESYIPLTIIMQTVAANLGGMIMPFGNPQSLYIFSFFKLTLPQYVSVMAPPFVLSLIIIAGICLFVKKEEVSVLNELQPQISRFRIVFYLLLSIVALLTVFDVITYIMAGIIVVAGILIFDVKAFLKVDFGLLLTFVAFFIFANNMARIDAVNSFVSKLVNQNTLLVSVISCQLISNVPSGIFLSNFTTNWKGLLLGVNIGGIGTIISSLASLITLKTYIKAYPNKLLHYFGLFSIVNFSILAILLAFGLLLVTLI